MGQLLKYKVETNSTIRQMAGFSASDRSQHSSKRTDTSVNVEKRLAIFVFLWHWLDTNGSVPVTYLTEGTVQIQYFLCGVLNKFPWGLKDQIFYTPQRTVEI